MGQSRRADSDRPPSRTGTESFVVQLHRDDLEGQPAFRGRVEHLASGAEIQFGTVDDLLAFLLRTRTSNQRIGE